MRILDRLIVRVKAPSGTKRKLPSEALNQAMVSWLSPMK